jgi:group II intron reverse transcriptase/maturase
METNTETKLTLIAEHAKEKTIRFTSLAHLLNSSYLMNCSRLLARGKAAGIDGRTLESYQPEELEREIEKTVAQLKIQKYQPQPVRKVAIPKENGEKRFLGLPTVIDKIVQLGLTRILETIYEPVFLSVAYGYRPGRDAHQALKEINHLIMGRKVNFVIEADIKGFFDHVDHATMMRCLNERIADPNFKRIIWKCLKAGVMEGGKIEPTIAGTPQGGIISPILANIYLHYVLDLWFEKRIKTKIKGFTQLIRYADDFLIGVQYKEEAEMIMGELRLRLSEFGLTLSEEKTRIIEFGRFAEENRKKKGKGKPETFEFLGFTHYCTQTRDGRFRLGYKTSKKRMKRASISLTGWLKSIRNKLQPKIWWPVLVSKVQGHYNYYGISGNFYSIKKYYEETRRLTFKWLNRRSQKKSWSRKGFERYLSIYPLPKPKLTYAIFNTW